MNRDFNIIIDTREQRPYLFAGAIRRALPTGDYSVQGFESQISIERKSLSDLLGCIGGSRDRFERECARLATIEFAAMVIEGTLSQLLTSTRSEIHPSARLGSLCAWSMKYRLPIFFCGDRKLAQMVTERLLTKAAKYAAEDG